MEGAFRRLNVDQYDPSKFLSLQDLLPPLPAVDLGQVQATATQVRSLLSSGDYGSALTKALENPPYAGDEQAKVCCSFCCSFRSLVCENEIVLTKNKQTGLEFEDSARCTQCSENCTDWQDCRDFGQGIVRCAVEVCLQGNGKGKLARRSVAFLA